jgi:hypothetical protein
MTLDDTTVSPLRAAVQQYAANLCEALAKLGVISATDGQTPRSMYLAATLRAIDQPAAIDRSPSQRGDDPDSNTGQRRHDHPLTPLPEDRVLDDWLHNGMDGPLLIVAPAGSGKSCLLESFAYRLATELRDDNKWTDSDGPPVPIPILIPLHRALAKELSVRDFVYQAESDLLRHVLPKRDSVLSPAILDSLIEKRQIAFLVDGFDEIPVKGDNLAVQIAALQAFVLTSRPGHGEYWVIRDVQQHRTLQELTSTQAREYVRGHFAECSHIDAGRAVRLFNESWRQPIGRILSRPLFLKAWCESLDETDATKSPQSAADLARQLLRMSLKWRGLSDVGECSDALLDRFIDWFGHIGLCFFHDLFDGQPHRSLFSERLLATPSDLPPSLAKIDFKALALQSGLFIHLDRSGRYIVPRTPLVEYIIGTFLADDAVRNPKSPGLLVEFFGRWIWQPGLHDILDYTFDALWHRNQKWAHALLEWAVTVGRHDPSRSSPLFPPANDDLLRPLVVAALQWYSLQIVTDDTDAVPAQRAAQDAAASHATLVRYHVMDFLEGLILHKSVWRYLVQGLAIQDALATDWWTQFHWPHKTGSAVVQVREDDAADVVHQFIVRLAEAPIREKRCWSAAIRGVAGRISEASAAKIVDRWIAKHNEAADEAVRDTLREAVEAAAKRICSDDASRFIHRWLKQCTMPASAATPREAWYTAITNAAERVREDDATTVVNALIQASPKPCKDASGVTWDCAYAITRAASRVGETEALDLLDQWLTNCADAQDKAITRLWSLAVDGVVKRFTTDAAARGIRRLLAHCKAKNGLDSNSLWLIRQVVEKLKADDAPDIVVDLIGEYNSPTDKDLKEKWDRTIRDAAERIMADDAAKVIEQWITARRYAGNEATRLAWVMAIRATASRIPIDSASTIICRWIEYHDNPQDGVTPIAWLLAIQGAAIRIPPGDAAGFTQRFCDKYRAANDAVARQLWQSALTNAAARIQSDKAFEIVQSLIPCQDAEKDTERKDYWWDCIKTAAEAATNADATQFVQECLASYDETNHQRWLALIEIVTARIHPDDALDIVQQLIERHGHTPNPIFKARLELSIETAARRVCPMDADELIALLLAEHEKTSREHEKREWRIAIYRAAARVPQKDYIDVVNRLLALRNMWADDEEEKAWRSAVEDIATSSVRNGADEPLNLLFNAGFADVVFPACARQSAVAIISRPVTAPAEVTFEAVPRNRLELDGSVAPDRIKAMLLDNGSPPYETGAAIALEIEPEILDATVLPPQAPSLPHHEDVINWLSDFYEANKNAFQAYWCIGEFDKDRFGNGESARGLGTIEDKFTAMYRTFRLGIAEFSQSYLAKQIKALEELFNKPPFTDHLWLKTDEPARFRVALHQPKKGDKKGEGQPRSKWTERGKLVWLYLDAFFQRYQNLRPKMTILESDRLKTPKRKKR